MPVVTKKAKRPLKRDAKAHTIEFLKGAHDAFGEDNYHLFVRWFGENEEAARIIKGSQVTAKQIADSPEAKLLFRAFIQDFLDAARNR